MSKLSLTMLSRASGKTMFRMRDCSEKSYFSAAYNLNLRLQPYLSLVKLNYQALGRKVVGLNLPAIPEVTLSSHSSSSLTIPKCKNGTRPMPGKIRVDSEDHYMKARAECR